MFGTYTIHIHTHTYVNPYTHTRTHTPYVRIYVHDNMHTSHIFVRTYIRTHTHTYVFTRTTHTYTHTSPVPVDVRRAVDSPGTRGEKEETFRVRGKDRSVLRRTWKSSLPQDEEDNVGSWSSPPSPTSTPSTRRDNDGVPPSSLTRVWYKIYDYPNSHCRVLKLYVRRVVD